MRTVVQSRYHVLFLLLTACPFFTGCGSSGGDLPTANIPATAASNTGSPRAAGGADVEPYALVPDGQEFQSPARALEDFYPEVVIKTSQGDLRVRLNAEKSPRTVDNFLYNYVDSGFYTQTVFHFVEQGYLMAGGGYTAELIEKPTSTPIPCEANNGLSNKRGTLAMARHPDFAHSATSQFFINLVDNPSLDFRPSDDDAGSGYCVFGEVIEGMDTVDKIASVAVHDRGEFVKTPVEPIVIESISRVK
jgi:peptidyl-prolyl cis-trans isomerase A (cyclophilin A)